jgi:hypothetical protein
VPEEFEAVLNWESEDTKWMTFEELENLEDKHFGLVELLHHSKDLISGLVQGQTVSF